MLSYPFLLALSIVGAVGLASQFERGRLYLRDRLKLIFILAGTVAFGLAFYLTFEQYNLWAHDPLSKFLLPPHQSISYFVFYSLTRFFIPYLISFAAAILLLTVAGVFNKKQGGRFFEKREPYLAALSVFLVGHPGWLVYLVALLLFYFVFHVSYFIFRERNVRLPLYRFWAPTAFFVILLNEYWASHTHWWALLNF